MGGASSREPASTQNDGGRGASGMSSVTTRRPSPRRVHLTVIGQAV